AEDGIRDFHVTGVQTCALPISEELVERACQLGYAALALTDECSVAGVVRAHVEARDRGFKLIVGSEFRLDDGLRLVLLAENLNRSEERRVGKEGRSRSTQEK